MKMQYNWNEAETVKIGVRGSKPRITIRKTGGVHLNTGFVRDNNLQHKKYVKVLIIKEEEKAVIGFIFLDEKEEDSLKVAFGKNNNAGFSGRSIFTEAGFDTEKKAPISFEPKIGNYKNDKIYIIELDIT